MPVSVFACTLTILRSPFTALLHNAGRLLEGGFVEILSLQSRFLTESKANKQALLAPPERNWHYPREKNLIRSVEPNPDNPAFRSILEEDLKEAGLADIVRSGVFDTNWRGFSFAITPDNRLIRHASSWTLTGPLPKDAQKVLATAKDRLRGYSREVTAWTVDELKQFREVILRFLLPSILQPQEMRNHKEE